MTASVFLVCGVQGSGKTWVLTQLADHFTVVANDDYIGKDYVAAIVAATTKGQPVLADCPFGERSLRAALEAAGVTVRPYFIVEPTEVVAARYLARTGQPLPHQAQLRTRSIKDRAIEWAAPHGTAEDVLELLRLEVD